MFEKTNLPETTSGLVGSGVDFRDNIPFCEIILPHKTEENQYKKGNRCGHNPLKPRIFVSPEHHKRRIPFLETAKARMGEAYHAPLKYDVAPIFYHQDKLNKDGSYRKVRTEAKEMAACLFGKALLHVVNLGKMAAGYFDDKRKQFVYFDLEYFANVTNTSLKRVYRITDLFKRSGYIEIVERKKRLANGEYRSLSPIIKVNKKFFVDLGFEITQVEFHHQRGLKELEKKEKKAGIDTTLDVEKKESTQKERDHYRRAAEPYLKMFRELANKLKSNTS